MPRSWRGKEKRGSFLLGEPEYPGRFFFNAFFDWSLTLCLPSKIWQAWGCERDEGHSALVYQQPCTVHVYSSLDSPILWQENKCGSYSTAVQQSSTLTPSGTPGTRAKLFTIKYQTMPDRMSMEQNLRPMLLFGELYIGPCFTASAWAEQDNYGLSCSIDRGIYCPSTRKSVGLWY